MRGVSRAAPHAFTAWSFLSQLKAKKPLQVITWLCDQIRQYYISLFTAPEAEAPLEGTGKNCSSLAPSTRASALRSLGCPCREDRLSPSTHKPEG